MSPTFRKCCFHAPVCSTYVCTSHPQIPYMIRIYFICYLCLSMCSENHRLTFRRVIKKGSVEEFSCVPYILALFNCLLYTWYGLPVVSSGWENSTVSSINGLGILLEIAFISIYTWFAPRERKASSLQRNSSDIHDT